MLCVPTCVVAGCGNTALDGVSLYKWPKDVHRTSHLTDLWKAFVKRTNPRWVEPSPKTVVCSDHFAEDQFSNKRKHMDGGYKRWSELKTNAVPSLYPITIPVPGDEYSKTRQASGKGEIVRIIKLYENLSWSTANPPKTSSRPDQLCSTSSSQDHPPDLTTTDHPYIKSFDIGPLQSFLQEKNKTIELMAKKILDLMDQVTDLKHKSSKTTHQTRAERADTTTATPPPVHTAESAAGKDPSLANVDGLQCINIAPNEELDDETDCPLMEVEGDVDSEDAFTHIKEEPYVSEEEEEEVGIKSEYGTDEDEESEDMIRPSTSQQSNRGRVRGKKKSSSQQVNRNRASSSTTSSKDPNEEVYREILLSQQENHDLLMANMAEDGDEEEGNNQPMEHPNQLIMEDVCEQNPNTYRQTRQVMNRFVVWLQDQNINEDVLVMKPEDLNTQIGLFLMNLRKKDGSEMEPDSISSFHRAIDRYLRDNNYGESILTSDTFQSSREFLNVKRKKLKALGLGKKPNRSEPLTDVMIETLWTSGELGLRDPRSLQNTIFFFFTQGFGFRGSHDSRQIKWSDVELLTDEDSREYLIFKDKHTETKIGNFSPKIFAIGGDRCPIKFYKIYASHRPNFMLEPAAPFYLSVKPNVNITDKVWYSSQAMGINTISKIMSNMAKRCSLPGKITNNSLRKSTCQCLIDSGVPPLLACQVTGHKNVSSLLYNTVDMHHQRVMSNIITSASTNKHQSWASVTSIG